MSNEIMNTQNTELQAANTFEMCGFEETNSEDIVIPRIKVINALYPERQDGIADEGDVIIDPCAGSGSTLRACQELGRNSYGFESFRDFYNRAMSEMLKH